MAQAWQIGLFVDKAVSISQTVYSLNVQCYIPRFSVRLAIRTLVAMPSSDLPNPFPFHPIFSIMRYPKLLLSVDTHTTVKP